MIEDHEPLSSPGPRCTSETTITGNKSILGDELCTAMHIDMPAPCSLELISHDIMFFSHNKTTSAGFSTFVRVSDIYAGKKREADS